MHAGPPPPPRPPPPRPPPACCPGCATRRLHGTRWTPPPCARGTSIRQRSRPLSSLIVSTRLPLKLGDVEYVNTAPYGGFAVVVLPHTASCCPSTSYRYTGRSGNSSA